MKAENSDKILAILKGFGHIKFVEKELICHNCGERTKGPARAKSLRSHLYEMLGFVGSHENCEPPKEIQP